MCHNSTLIKAYENAGVLPGAENVVRHAEPRRTTDNNLLILIHLPQSEDREARAFGRAVHDKIQVFQDNGADQGGAAFRLDNGRENPSRPRSFT